MLASDRGLCGSFNNNLIKYFVKTVDRSKEIQGVGVGRRTRDFINRNSLSGGKQGETANTPSFANASEIATAAIRDFISGEVDQVVLIYNQFKSALSQVPTHVQLLPFAKPARKAEAKPGKAGCGTARRRTAATATASTISWSPIPPRSSTSCCPSW